MRAAELLVARPQLTVRALARALGCSASTAHADLVAIRAEWAERRRDLVEQAAAEDLARTDAAIAAIWPAVLAGKPWAIDRLVSLLTYRMRALGLERVRHDVEVAVETEVGELLARYLARLHAHAASETDSL
jgi:chromosome segregation and condensation protein ScpB